MNGWICRAMKAGEQSRDIGLKVRDWQDGVKTY